MPETTNPTQSGTITPSVNPQSTVTKEILEAPMTIDLTPVSEVVITDVAVAPASAVEVDTSKKTVNYTEVPNPVLPDINGEVLVWASETSAMLNLQNGKMNQSIVDMKGSVNNALEALSIQLSGMLKGVNDNFELLQNNDALRDQKFIVAINRSQSQMTSNINLVKQAILTLKEQMQGMDNVYSTDSDFSARVLQVNALLDTLRGTDMDFVGLVKTMLTSINSMFLIKPKTVTVTASNGEYEFDMVAEGLPEFIDKKNYYVTCQVIGNRNAFADIVSKTKDGFKVVVESKGVHFLPKVVNCSGGNTVDVVVQVVHARQSPLEMGVSTLSESWIQSGATTQLNTL